MSRPAVLVPLVSLACLAVGGISGIGPASAVRTGPALLGETVVVTLGARVSCPTPALHVVFAMDESASSVVYSGTRKIANQGSRMVQSMDMGRHPEVRAGVVAFKTKGRTLCPLTDNEGWVLGSLAALHHSGDTAIEAGLEEGRAVLRRGLSGVDEGTLAQVLVLISDGIVRDGCEGAVRASRRLQAEGVRVMAVNLYPVDEGGTACLRSVASSPADYFPADSPGLGRALPPIRDRYAGLVRQLTVVDALSGQVAYEAGSARPEPAPTSGGRLEWLFGAEAADGLTITLRARTTATGRVSTHLEASGVLTDVVGRSAAFVLPMPWIDIVEPDRPPAPSPTATVRPTSLPPEPPVPTRAATASPTPEMRSEPAACLLPYALRGAK